MDDAAEANRRDLPIAIVGGGPTGMALALALHRVGMASEIFDARQRQSAGADKRVLALSHGSRQTLEWLGVWHDVGATPITTIHVSQRGGFGRTHISAAEHGLPALGYVVRAESLIAVLQEAIRQRGIPWHEEARVAEVLPREERIEFYAAQQQRCARLLAYAEGVITEGPGIASRDYRQMAVLCQATPRSSHHNCAWERFTPLGPFALLPTGKDLSVVFTCTPQLAEELMALDDDGFHARLQSQFGTRVTFDAVGPRSVFPLLLRYRRNPIAARQVWLGNAAQTLHPVAGQGYNLALRDVRELARRLSHAADPGAREVLEAYAAQRRLDRRAVIATTDSLVRLFSNDHPVLRHARGLGLAVLDLAPPARSFLARRMMFGSRALP